MFFSKEIDSILSVGLSLEEIGVKNWALSREESLIAIFKLKNINVAILGGDTFKKGEINPTGDSWWCNQDTNENDNEFLLRSTNVAENFIKNCIYDELKFIITPKV